MWVRGGGGSVAPVGHQGGVGLVRVWGEGGASLAGRGRLPGRAWPGVAACPCLGALGLVLAHHRSCPRASEDGTHTARRVRISSRAAASVCASARAPEQYPK